MEDTAERPATAFEARGVRKDRVSIPYLPPFWVVTHFDRPVVNILFVTIVIPVI